MCLVCLWFIRCSNRYMLVSVLMVMVVLLEVVLLMLVCMIGWLLILVILKVSLNRFFRFNWLWLVVIRWVRYFLVFLFFVFCLVFWVRLNIERFLFFLYWLVLWMIWLMCLSVFLFGVRMMWKFCRLEIWCLLILWLNRVNWCFRLL